MHVIRKLVAVLALAGACGAASAAPRLVINHPTSVADRGDPIILEVLGTDFTDIVVSGGFNLDFDAHVLHLESVTINTALWDFVCTQPACQWQIDNVAGTLTDVSFNAFGNSPTGDFLAATLGFTAKAPGTSALTLSASKWPFVNADAEEIDVSYNYPNDSVASVTVVPEPATVASMLLGLGLLGIARLRRSVDAA